MIRLPSSIWPKPEPSSSRNEISWSGRPSAELLVQPADLERGDDAHRAVVAAAVAVRVAVGADAEDRLPGRPVAGDERADRILGDLEAERLAARARSSRACSGRRRRVGVAADRLARERVVRPGERLDVALDPLRARLRSPRPSARS